jgi:cell division protease FtsH
VVERAESGNIKPGNPSAVIRPDPSVDRNWVVITGESRKDASVATWKPFRAAGRLTDGSMERLQRSKLFVEQPSQTILSSIAVQVVPFVLIIGLLYFLFVRQLRQAGRGALSFGKSRAKLLTRDRDKITFADVAGCDEAKEEVSEVVEFLKDPKKFHPHGRADSEGYPDGRPPGHGQDPPRQGGRRRGRCAVLQHLGLGLRRNVRRRRRQPRARHVRAGPQERRPA